MTKKVIGLEEFGKLALEQQLNVLYQDGVHVGKRVIQESIVILYQLNDFYVEVYYKEYRKDVKDVIVSNNIEIVHPYLSQISVRDLDQEGSKE